MKRFSCVLLIGFLLVGCGSAKLDDQEVIVVRVPPFVDPESTAGENQCLFDLFLFSSKDQRITASNVGCKDAPLANYDGLLFVSLKEDRSLSLNYSENVGRLSNTSQLKDRLKGIFQNHADLHVFEPDSNSVVKAVGIRLPKSARYSELIEIAKAAKESGADPIVLLLDGHLPQYQIFAP
jgi:hypothetical protein